MTMKSAWMALAASLFVFFASPSLAEVSDDPHEAIYSESSYPSASECGTCHQLIYKEWASSNHAYSSISPMFHKFEQAITNLTQGTIGSFCVRCHQQVGTQRGEKRDLPLWERSKVAREGVTCITCHRISEAYGKVNGERSIVPGNIFEPVSGTKRDGVFEEVVKELGVITGDDQGRGQKVHAGVVPFDQLGKSEFCQSCHQVAVNLGIKLEVVWEQYRDSPAFEAGVTCQDCHMGKVPGVAAGYATAPTAIVNGQEINPGRRHSNHAFYGPGYPVAHPGIFPHNPDAEAFDIEDWLAFDYRAGWGTEDFEENIEEQEAPFSALHEALEPLGGGLEALAGLDALDKAFGRGTRGFATEIGRGRLAGKLEALDGLIDSDAFEDGLAAAEEAMDEIADIESGDADLSAPVDNMRAKFTNISAQLAQAGGFDDALAAVQERLETLNENSTEDDIASFQALVEQMRSAMPGANREFQDAVLAVKAPLNIDFPYAWSDPSDREDARVVVDDNIVELEYKRDLRRQVMENGSRIDGPYFESPLQVGQDLDFKYVVTNLDDGHNLPSGSLGAQPELWLNVALVDPDGNNVWESGYVDSNGDFADVHSLDVAAGKIEFDDQLFNLQTKFLTTNVKGTEREMYLPVNFDLDQRPLLRPSNVPTTILNHAPFVRMEGRSLPPLASRDAEYSVPGELITKPGTYRLAVRMRSRAEPIYFMRFVGATEDMERSMNEWMLDIHPYAVEFEVK